MQRTIVVGAASGLVVFGVAWALAGSIVQAIGTAGAAVWSGADSVGGASPQLWLRWGLHGAARGLLGGALIGAALGYRGTSPRSWKVGVAVAGIGTLVSSGEAMYAEGTGVLAGFPLIAVVGALGSLLALGGVAGAAAHSVLERLTFVAD